MPVGHMDAVNEAAIKYLRELLSDDNQRIIADALRQYQAGEGSRMDEFKEALKKRIDEKKRQYDTLMKNISAGVLPDEVLADIGQQMKELRSQITTLEHTEPPKDFTVDTIRAWLESIKAAPDAEAVRLLIERIDITQDREKEKTDFSIQSTLKTVLSKNGCGRGI